MALGCTGGVNQQQRARPPAGPASPPYPTDFTPLPPLAEPLPPNPDQPGLPYLQAIYEQVGPRWSTFLEDCRLRLAPSHPLNDTTRAVRLDVAVNKDGGLASVTVKTSSGVEELDAAALEIVRDAAPFPAPPGDWVSDDDLTHVSWLFARDQRQAGTATAELVRIIWPVARAVPKFLGTGDVTTAAQRLSHAAGAPDVAANGAQAASPAELVTLGKTVAVAVIREGLRSKDVATQRLAVATAREAKLLATASELRGIIDTAVEVNLRGEAMDALGAIGDQGAGPLLVTLLEASKGSGAGGAAEGSAAAARALAAIGQGLVAESTLMSWLAAGDEASRWAALVSMAEFPVPEAAPVLAELVTGAATPRDIRLAACTALGTSLSPSRIADTTPGMRALVRALEHQDAAVRAACARATAQAARAGVRSRVAFWKVVEMMAKDRDERVRAAAVLAAAALEPGRFDKEMYVLRKEKSKQVQAALAEALAIIPASAAVGRLSALLGDADPEVRRRAAASLAQHMKDARARTALAKATGDTDPQVRARAARALADAAALRGLLGDPVLEVRGAAFAAIVAARGQHATLAEMARSVAEAEPGSAARVHWARAWLVP